LTTPLTGRDWGRNLVALERASGRAEASSRRATDQGSANDRVTTDRLARMRHRLSELEHISESTSNEAEAMAAENEVQELMDSLENVRELRPREVG
jgi:hypothetical protein